MMIKGYRYQPWFHIHGFWVTRFYKSGGTKYYDSTARKGHNIDPDIDEIYALFEGLEAKYNL